MIATNEQILSVQVGDTVKTKRGHTLVADWNSRHNEIDVQVYDAKGSMIAYLSPKSYVSIYGGDIE